MRDLTEQGIQRAKELEEHFGKHLDKSRNFLKEFQKFAMRGNVVDLAIGVVIGAAFGKIVTSMVGDIIMPLLGLIVGKVDLNRLYIALDHRSYPNIEAAIAAKAPILAYGNFLKSLVDFVIVAFVIFVVVKQINKFTKGPPPPAATKECQQCLSVIPVKATRCAHCAQLVM